MKESKHVDRAYDKGYLKAVLDLTATIKLMAEQHPLTIPTNFIQTELRDMYERYAAFSNASKRMEL